MESNRNLIEFKGDYLTSTFEREYDAISIFEDKYREWAKAYFYVLTIEDTHLLKISDFKEEPALFATAKEKLKYKDVVYACVHYGKPEKKKTDKIQVKDYLIIMASHVIAIIIRTLTYFVAIF